MSNNPIYRRDFLGKLGKVSLDSIVAGGLPVPGIVAHRSALKDGETLKIPQYVRPRA